MRRFITITVAAVLVATCGPAPCPCHLVAILRPATKQDTPVPTPSRPACKCCHADSTDDTGEASAPSASQSGRTPPSPKPPCGHGSKVELGVTNVVNAVQVEASADCVTFAPRNPISELAPDLSVGSTPLHLDSASSPQLRALRFTHAFRS